MFTPNLYSQEDRHVYNVVNHKGEVIRTNLSRSEARGVMKFASLYGMDVRITTNTGMDVTGCLLREC